MVNTDTVVPDILLWTYLNFVSCYISLQKMHLLSLAMNEVILDPNDFLPVVTGKDFKEVGPWPVWVSG